MMTSCVAQEAARLTDRVILRSCALRIEAGITDNWEWTSRELEPHRLWDNTCFVGSFEQQFYSLTASVTVVNRVVVYVHPDKRIGQRFRHTAAVLHRVTHSDLTVL